MYIENYEPHLSDLHDGKISYQEFLRNAGCEPQFLKWCADHNVEPDGTQANLFFDMHGFEESVMTKEFIEPAAS